MMRSKKIGRSHITLAGVLTSVKDDLAKAFQSPLEKDFLVLLDFDWNVDRFYDQPVRISYKNEIGELHYYNQWEVQQ